ncbi:molybdenum cofactor guanylyltransferase [Asticcacaulis sp. W401b]|uniref:molybdenum cofactor guanylyltransferase n=1 Tax=Asticcacaulis sp. W401b TaxID=3388666 RepID=UPI00397088C5
MILGVVLCGGKSTRMGQDKAGLVHEGRTWLQIMTGLLFACGVDQVSYAGRPDLPSGFSDRFPGIGPLGGLLTSIETAPANTHCLVVVPVDMPCLSVICLRELVETCCLSMVPVHFQPTPLPLALPLRAASRAAITSAAHAAVKSGGYSLKRLLHGLGGIELPDPGGNILQNLNSPEDLAILPRN